MSHASCSKLEMKVNKRHQQIRYKMYNDISKSNNMNNQRSMSDENFMTYKNKSEQHPNRRLLRPIKKCLQR